MRDAFGKKRDCPCNYYVNGGCVHTWFEVAREAMRELEERMTGKEWREFKERLHMTQVERDG